MDRFKTYKSALEVDTYSGRPSKSVNKRNFTGVEDLMQESSLGIGYTHQCLTSYMIV